MKLAVNKLLGMDSSFGHSDLRICEELCHFAAENPASSNFLHEASALHKSNILHAIPIEQMSGIVHENVRCLSGFHAENHNKSIDLWQLSSSFSPNLMLDPLRRISRRSPRSNVLIVKFREAVATVVVSASTLLCKLNTVFRSFSLGSSSLSIDLLPSFTLLSVRLSVAQTVVFSIGSTHDDCIYIKSIDPWQSLEK